MAAHEPEQTLLEPFMLEGRSERLREVAAYRTRGLTVLLDGVHDPHNLSAVVRSCDAFGLLDLHVIESQARFRVRSKISQGCEKWLDIHRHAGPENAIDTLRASGHELWVADASKDSIPVDQVPFQKRLALVFGNEHRGASAKLREAANGTFHIPMHGFSESFNISVAAAITLAIAARQRERLLGRHGDLSPEEQKALVWNWQKRSVKHAKLILARLAQEDET